MDEKPWSPFAEVYDPLMCGSIDRTDVEPHDHGIIRAISANYTPDPVLVNDPVTSIFVSNIDPNSKDEQVQNLFAEYGPIKQFRRVRDLVTGYSKGYAFVEFENKYDAVAARNRGHKTSFDGKELVVEFELERTLPGWKPRRLGGGFGGRKESGQLRFGGRERPFRKPIMMDENGPMFRSGMEGFEGRKMEHRDRPHGSEKSYGGFGRSHRDRHRDGRSREDGHRRYRERRRSRERSRSRESSGSGRRRKSRERRERKGRY